MNKKLNRREFIGSSIALTLLGMHQATFAGTYPDRAVRLVNPFAPGGSADIVSRLVAASLSEILGANIFVENVPGAGGTIGSTRVARAQPDGYTLLLSNVASQAIAPSLYPKIDYNVEKDFSHIALFGAFPNVLVVGPAVRATTVQEFIEEAKAQKNSFNFGSAGSGSTPHLSAELFKLRTNIDAQHVPYKGAGPALMALIGGELSFQFENISSALPQIRNGRLRPLAVTSAKRVASLPDVPTVEESGVKDFVIGSWYGVSAPANTPDLIINTMRKGVEEMLASPEFKTKLTALGLELPTISPSEYPAFVAAENKRWAAIIESSGAKVD